MTFEFGLGWNTQTSSRRVLTTATQHSVSYQSRCFVVSLRTMNSIS